MKLIPSGEVARLLGIKTGTLAKWRRERKGPQGWVFASSTRVMYPEEAVLAYLAALTSERPKAVNE